MPAEFALNIARIPLGNGLYLYVTPEHSLPNTRPITDPNWISLRAYKIAECFVGVTRTRWFGIDVSGLSDEDKIQWVGDMILWGVDHDDNGLKLHCDDPSSTFDNRSWR